MNEGPLNPVPKSLSWIFPDKIFAGHVAGTDLYWMPPDRIVVVGGDLPAHCVGTGWAWMSRDTNPDSQVDSYAWMSVEVREFVKALFHLHA